MKNFLSLLFFAVFLQYWFIEGIHERSNLSYEYSWLILLVLFIVLIFIYIQNKSKLENIIAAFFVGFFITFLASYLPVYNYILEPNFVVIERATLLDENKNSQLLIGDFDYDYIYKIDLLESSSLLTAKIECEKYLFWQTAFVNGFHPYELDRYLSLSLEKGELILFFNIFFYSFIEVVLISVFSNFPFIFLYDMYYRKKGKNIFFNNYNNIE